MSYDLSKLYSQIDQKLMDSQVELEGAIKAYGQACDVYADAFVAYRTAKAEAIKRLKGEGAAISIAVELAQGETAQLKGELLKAEGNRRRVEKMIDAYELRINSFKFIGKDRAGVTK